MLCVPRPNSLVKLDNNNVAVSSYFLCALAHSLLVKYAKACIEVTHGLPG